MKLREAIYKLQREGGYIYRPGAELILLCPDTGFLIYNRTGQRVTSVAHPEPLMAVDWEHIKTVAQETSKFKHLTLIKGGK